MTGDDEVLYINERFFPDGVTEEKLKQFIKEKEKEGWIYNGDSENPSIGFRFGVGFGGPDGEMPKASYLGIMTRPRKK